jgi:hypothetical protein
MVLLNKWLKLFGVTVTYSKPLDSRPMKVLIVLLIKLNLYFPQLYFQITAQADSGNERKGVRNNRERTY